MFVLQMLNYKYNEKEKNEFSDFLKFILYYCTVKLFKSSGVDFIHESIESVG